MNTEEIQNAIRGNSFKVHQSRLKHLLGAYPFKFIEEYIEDEIPKDHFIIGNLAETIFLEPEEVDNRFEKITRKIPEGMVADLITGAREINPGWSLDMDKNKAGWIDLGKHYDLGRGRWTDEVMFKKFLVQQDYWVYLKTRDPNRQPVTVDLYETAEALAQGFAASQQTAPLFMKTPIQDILVQYYVEFEYMDVPCAGTLDILKIDKKNKTLQVIDIKTTSRGWRSAASSGRWDIQGAFYTYGIKMNPPTGYSDYTVINPIYIVSHTKYPNNPKLLNFSDRDLITGQYGAHKYRTVSYGDNMPVNLPYPIDGFHQLMERYKFHQGIGKWDKKMELFNTEHKEYLDLF